MEPGMVTSIEPALFVYDLGGFRHSDTVIIGKDKPEVTTNYMKELEDLIISFKPRPVSRKEQDLLSFLLGFNV